MGYQRQSNEDPSCPRLKEPEEIAHVGHIEGQPAAFANDPELPGIGAFVGVTLSSNDPLAIHLLDGNDPVHHRLARLSRGWRSEENDVAHVQGLRWYVLDEGYAAERCRRPHASAEHDIGLIPEQPSAYGHKNGPQDQGSASYGQPVGDAAQVAETAARLLAHGSF